MYNDSKDIVESIDEKNKIIKNNNMNINFNDKIVKHAVVVIKIENKILQNIVLK